MRIVLRDTARTLRGPAREFHLRIPHFEVAQGEVVALVGESGSGKTAMLELLALAAEPDPGGEFLLEGPETVDILALWQQRRLGTLASVRATRLGFVAQAGGLLPFLSARGNAALAQEVAGQTDAARLSRLAERLGIAAVLDERPVRLSLGQRQRAAILRALAHQPDFIIADEPTSALDPGAGEEVMNLFLSTAVEEGAGVILSSHNVSLMRHAGAEIVEVLQENLPDPGTAPDSQANEDATPASGTPSAPSAGSHAGNRMVESDPSQARNSPGFPPPAVAPARWVSRVERAP